MILSKIIKSAACHIGIEAENKNIALHRLSELFKKIKELQNLNEDTIYNAFMERESKGSTGFGGGIAIPHCQIEGVKDFFIAVAVSRKGVNFDSFDKKKVKLFVAIVGPKGDDSAHLKLLAKVSRIFREPGKVDSLLHAPSSLSLYEEMVRSGGEEIIGKSAQRKSKMIYFIVKDEIAMEQLTEVFAEYGVINATVLRAEKMESLISKIPLFLGFFNFTNEKNTYTEVVMTAVSKDILHPMIDSIEDRVGNLDTYAGLDIIVMDIAYSKGI